MHTSRSLFFFTFMADSVFNLYMSFAIVSILKQNCLLPNFSVYVSQKPCPQNNIKHLTKMLGHHELPVQFQWTLAQIVQVSGTQFFQKTFPGVVFCVFGPQQVLSWVTAYYSNYFYTIQTFSPLHPVWWHLHLLCPSAKLFRFFFNLWPIWSSWRQFVHEGAQTLQSHSNHLFACSLLGESQLKLSSLSLSSLWADCKLTVTLKQDTAH